MEYLFSPPPSSEKEEKKAMEVEDDVTRIIRCADSCFCLNDTQHRAFYRVLRAAWKESGFQEISKGGITHARKWQDRNANRNRSARFSEVIVTHRGTDELTRLVMTDRDFSSLLEVVLRKTNWRNEVEKADHIPSAIRRAFHSLRLDVRGIFPRIKEPDDSGPYHALCSPRFQYGKRMIGSYRFESDDDDGDDCDYASSRSESEGEASQEESEEHAMVEVTSEVEVLLRPDEEVITRRLREEGRMVGVHPYQLSCAVFSMCQRIETKEWPARRIYAYVRDYLCDQVRSHASDEIRALASEILHHASDMEHSDRVASYIEAFEGAAPMVYKHRRKFMSDRAMMAHGKLEAFERLSDQQLAEVARDRFHPFHPPSRGRFPSLFHCPCGRQECRPAAVRFSRARVSPLQVHTSMCICEKKFRRTEQRPWSVVFTGEHVILIADEGFLREVTADVVPYLLVRVKGIRRTVPIPTYYLHVHNYFYGSRLGLCTAMEFLLRSFSWMRYSKSAYMPKSLDDDVIESYRLLHLIMDKFETPDAITRCLADPLDSHLVPYGRKRKSTALEEDAPTLYASLRAFVLVYAAHYITRPAVIALSERFLESQTLRERHRLAWKLVKHLVDRLTIEGEREIEIPEGIFRTRDADYDQDASDTFDHPSHLLLYYLCASGDLSPSESRDLFLAIGSYSRVSGQLKIARYCSSISMRKQSPKARRAASMGGTIAYDLLNVKSSIPESGEERPFSRGITHLFRSLEDMDYGTAETLVPLSPGQILSDERRPPRVALDVAEDPPRAGECLPLWKSLIYDSSYRTSGIILSTENVGRSMVYTGEQEMRPFWGCHEDMLECVILQPISNVQCLTDDMDAPLDMREAGDPNTPPVNTPEGSPLEQRVGRLSQMFFAMCNDRQGWSDVPSVNHVFQRLHSQ